MVAWVLFFLVYVWAGIWFTFLCHVLVAAVDLVEHHTYVRRTRWAVVPVWVLMWLPVSVFVVGLGLLKSLRDGE